MRIRNASLSSLLAIAIVLFVACGDDSTTVECKSCACNPALCRTPTSKLQVLSDIEYAYNKKKVSTYNELLDDNFTFFYTESDASGQIPVQWGRDDEIKTTSGLLNAATSISLDLKWEDGVTWTTVVSGSEEWFYTTVFYNYTIKIGDTTYIPNAGAKAQFTVRNVGTAENPAWKLVQFRDLGGPSIAERLAGATEPTTWGAVKAKYRS